MNLFRISDKIVFNTLKNIKFGYLEITNHNGELLKFGNPKDSLKANLEIKNSNFTFNLIRGGSVGFAESYMKNEFETKNLSDLIEITARNIKQIHKFSGLLDLPFINFFKNILIKNTKNRSKENISKHYDLGNEFFSLWLDKSLTYSSAIFDDAQNDLELAQINKYKKLTNLIKPKSGDRILEIGCGWGGFAEFIGKNYDVKIDCITISKKQFDFAKARIQKIGLNEKVDITMRDYRDVKDKYSSIASIEMIEAVGKNYLKNYFEVIKNNLSKNGVAAIQAITINDKYFDRYKNREDFIQKYIFPGGFLPSKKSIFSLSDKSGLKVDSYNSYGSHYSKTLNIWKREFMNHWELISKQGFDITFKRMWNFYLSYCEAGFKSKNIDLIQFSLQNR